MKDRYITVYEVTRHFGGPEEGGWWYNHHEPIKTVAIPKVYQKTSARSVKKVWHLVDKLEKEHAHLEWGNIYHTTGGVMISVFTEAIRREFATTETPHYC